ncbi:tape measure protein [Corynebacterium hansenii]|uniref:Tape measure protein n=1 Tax=Corynebacterium hansenii TaxID=394964 RepID=A0ABV7ZM84_9CORY|nr:tape measure protein [Corynebacterium hansenii]WJY99277.1 Transglycosylase SLT domain protein [Corynebacterium hansenii]
MSTVGQAKVVFEAETGQVSDQLVAAMEKAMAKIDKILARMSQATETEGKKAGAGLADGLEDGAQRAGKAVDGIDGSGLSKVQEAAAKAGAAVADEMTGGVAKADAAMDKIDGSALHDVGAAAQEAGARIGAEIPAAAQRADAALDAIDGAGLREAGAAASSAAASIEGRVPAAAARASAAIDDVGASSDQAFDKGVAGAGLMEGALGKLALAAGAMIGPMTVLKKGWDRLVAQDDAQHKLIALGHTTEDVSAIMDNAMSAVTGTAFGFGEAASQAATLVAAGVQPGADLERVLRLVADSASIAGTDLADMGMIWGKAAARGRISGEEMAMLLDRQIGLLPALAEHYGVTTEAAEKMVSDGKVSFEDFTQVMENMVGGGAEIMGQTVTGSLKNVGAAAGRLGEALLKPIFQAAPAFLGGVQKGLNWTTNVIKGFMGWLDSGSLAADIFKYSLVALGTAMTVIVAPSAAAGIAAFVSGLWKGSAAAAALGKVIAGLKAAISAAFVTSPIGWVIVGITALVAAFVILWKRSEAFRDFWTGLWNTIADPVRQAIDAVKGAWDGLTAIFRGEATDEGNSALARLIGADRVAWIISTITTVKQLWQDVKTAFGGGEVPGGGALARLVGIDTAERVMEIIGSIKGAWGELWSAFQGDGSGTGALTALLGDEGRAEFVVNLFARLGDAARFVWDTIKQVGQALADVGTSIASAGWETIKAVFGALVEVGKSLWSAISEIAGAVWDLVQALAPVLMPILKVVGAIIGGVIVAAFFVLMGALRLVAGLFQILAGVISWLAENVLSPLIGIIGEVVGWLVEKLGGAIAGVVDFIRGLFETIGAVFSWVWEQLQAAWDNIGRPVVDFIIAAFQWWWEGIQLGFRLLGATFEVIWTGLQMAWDAWGRPVLDAIIQGFQWVWDGVQVIFGWLKAGWDLLWVGVRWVYDTIIAPVIGWIVDRFNDLRAGVQLALDWVRLQIDRVSKVVSAFYDQYVQPMVDRVIRGFDRVKDTVVGWKDKIVGALSGAGRWLWDTGRNIVQGLLNGIGSLAGRIGSFFLDRIPGWIKGPFKKALGIASPSKLFAEYGRNIGEGLVAGVGSMEGVVQASTQGLADSAANITLPAAPAVAAAPVVTDGAAPAIAADASTGIAEAYSGMAAQMGATSTGLLDPMWMGQSAQMMGLGTTMTTQAQGVIAPSWDAMAAQMAATQAGVITPTMAGTQAAMTQTAAVIMGQITTVIRTALQYLVTTLFWTLNSGVNPVFAGIRGGLQHVVSTFQWAVSSIGTLWSQVREATARPVRFTINSVFNDGVVGMWNSVSDLLGTTKMAPYPVRFASGGVLPGYTPGRDVMEFVEPSSGMRLGLSGGEAIMRPEWTRAVGGPAAVEAMNAAARSGGVNGVRRTIGEGAAARFSTGGILDERIQRTIREARRHHGKPYQWGGVGNPSFDCSGLWSGIQSHLSGGRFGGRLFTTHTFMGGGGARLGWVPGLNGPVTVGVNDGHMAGTLAGINMESAGGGKGVQIGGSAWGSNHGSFTRRFTLRDFTGRYIAGAAGGGIDIGDVISGEMDQYKQKMATAIAAFTRQQPGRLAQTYPTQVKEKLVDATQKKIDKLMEEMMGDPGGAGVARWAPMVRRALARVGFEVTERNVRLMLAQIASESGGNPGIAQQIVDINGTGDSAGVGLLQIIPSTFAAHRDPALPNDRRNPFANMVAALRYYKSRYGMDLGRMWGKGHGYAHGGLMGEGQGMFHKTAFGPERVLSPRQTASFERLVDWIDAQPSLPIQPVPAHGTGEDYGRHTKTVLVTQNIIADDPRAAADAVEDRLMGLLT